MEGVGEEEMGYLVVSREMPYGFDTLLENGIGARAFCWACVYGHHSSACMSVRRGT